MERIPQKHPCKFRMLFYTEHTWYPPPKLPELQMLKWKCQSFDMSCYTRQSLVQLILQFLVCHHTFATILEKGYPLWQEIPEIVPCAAKMFPINVAKITKCLCNGNALLCVQQNAFSHVNVFSPRFFTLSIDNPTYVMQICFVLIPRYCCRYHQSRIQILRVLNMVLQIS